MMSARPPDPREAAAVDGASAVRSLPIAVQTSAMSSASPTKANKTVRQSSPAALRTNGVVASPPPTTSPNSALYMLLTMMNSRG